VSLWKVLGPVDKSGANFGGFVGYNSQWDDIILGVDLTYSKTSFNAVSPVSPISRRTTAGGNVYDVTVFGSGNMKIHDWGSARFRAGWAVDNLMPYATVGLAFGPPDITRSATATGEENPPDPPQTCATDVTPPICVPFTFTKGEEKRNAWLFGWTVGGGLDYLVLPNVFLRAEYEYVSFAGVAGTKASINTARVGAGYRF